MPVTSRRIHTTTFVATAFALVAGLGVAATPGAAPSAQTQTGRPGAALFVPAPDDPAHLRVQAAAGDLDAMVTLAERLLAGNGMQPDPEAARTWLDKAAARDYPPALTLLGSVYYRGVSTPVDYHRARELIERALTHQYLPAINDLAWMLATCPDASLRDGKRALAMLAPAMDQSAQMLDTLAAAYAETGDFDNAVDIQTRAMAALGDTADPRFNDYAKRLMSYSRRQPWRDPQE